MQFKVGDKVRVKAGRSDASKKHAGKVGVILRISDVVEELDISPYSEGGFWMSEIEAVKEASELEKLVETANAGLAALRALYSKYRNKIEVEQKDGAIREANSGFYSSDSSAKLVRVKPAKPLFVPYKTKDEGYDVTVEGDRVTVGCAEFNLTALREGLKQLLRDDACSYRELSSMRYGITTSKGKISWASAEELLQKLEAYK